ncbi:ATP-binding protein [Actinoplanes sp. NPDC049681]|uniref:ATP-binding protein n=1 Tax=Actinoplanes sp. NPDC049681 TaxID=3363905 RepID=UPI003790EA35
MTAGEGGEVFGERVRSRRRELGLTQEELAAAARIDVKTVRMIETGRRTPRPATVRLLADALQLVGDARTRFLARAAVPRPAPVPARPVPAQLPPDVYGFVGRVAQLSALEEITASAADRPPAVIISAVSGSAGVGKTALAVHWAHRSRERFPDGQLYVNLRGFDPAGAALDPSEALAGFLDALGVGSKHLPAGPDARAALYRSLLADRRMLVVLDNARDPDQVRPLLPAASGCLTLVTSRDDLAGLVAAHGARPLGLHLLSDDESFQLLARRLGGVRLAGAPAAVEEIIASCVGLPLALTVVAARAATRPELRLDELAAQLRDARRRLDVLAVGDAASDVRAVFSWSYRALSADAARLFRLLGLHPGPDVSVAAAAGLAGAPIVATRLLLDELAAASLLTERTPGRFAFHDLLRAYASDQVRDDEREPAVRRMLDHYLHTALVADSALARHRNPVPPPAPAPGTLIEQPAGVDEAMTWFGAEHEVLLAVVEHAERLGHDVHVWHLAWALATYFHRRAHFHHWVATQEAAMAAAVRLGDRERQVRTHNELAGGYFNVGRVEDSVSHLRRAAALFEALGDRTGQAAANINLGQVLLGLDRTREALAHDEKALELYRAAGLGSHEASALNAVGWCHALLGDYARSLEFCGEALTLHLRHGDNSGLGEVWDSLGYAHHHLGDFPEAARCYGESLGAYRAAGDPYNEATVLTHLGDTHRAAGDTVRAADAWRRALTLLESLDHPDAAGVRTKLDALPGAEPGLG